MLTFDLDFAWLEAKLLCFAFKAEAFSKEKKIKSVFKKLST